MFNFNNEQIETEYITQINKLLESFERQIDIHSLEANYLSFMASGRSICETTAKLLLFKNEGYDGVQNTFFQDIEKLYDNNIIPKECYNFLHLIRTDANKVIHGLKISSQIIISFLKAFLYYIQWFDIYYSQNYQKNFPIEKICEFINSLVYDDENKEFKVDLPKKEYDLKYVNQLKLDEFKTNAIITDLQNKLAKLEEEKNELEKSINKKDLTIKEDILKEKIETLTQKLKRNEEIHQNEISELKKENKKILKELDENRKLLKRSIELLEESNERGKRVESKIDELHSKIDMISNQILTLQSLTKRQLDNTTSPEDIERIIQDYTNVCIEKIMEQSSNFSENQDYSIEKQKLIYSIGEESWNKLCERSKTFLITSKVMYNHMITINGIIDYSGICVLVTKALEVEMKKRFFTDFLDYLNGKYGNNYKNYHTALLHNYQKPKFSEKFSMGDIAFVMCPNKNWNDTDKQKTNNEKQLMAYCKKHVFSRYDESEIERLLKKYASSIEDIRDKYRNPSAHTNEIKRVNAEECFNLVLDVEKLLKKMLDSFDR